MYIFLLKYSFMVNKENVYGWYIFSVYPLWQVYENLTKSPLGPKNIFFNHKQTPKVK